LVSHDNTVEEIKLAAGDHSASSTFEVDLNEGSVTHYPLDSYVARVDVQLLDGKSSLKLPARAGCFWLESRWDSRIGRILIQPVGWAEASRNAKAIFARLA
jgi:hypothetical protein